MGDDTRIRFDERVAIVTGAGSGLGRAYALELAKRGCKVVVNDLGGAIDGTGGSKSAADAVAEEIRAAGGVAVPSYDSVATSEGGASIVNTALEHFRKVDILINNAGIIRDRSFTRMDWEDWDAMMRVHLYGAYNVTRPAFVAMRTGNYGRIIMTTSAAGLFGNFGQTNYGAAKLGVVGLMNTLKLEGDKYNIKVNTVAPLAATRLSEKVMPPGLSETLKAEYVVPLVVYLCSEQCQPSGDIFNAGAGRYSRVAIVVGRPTSLASEGEIPSVETMAANLPQIRDLEDVQEYANASALVTEMLGKGLVAPPR